MHHYFLANQAFFSSLTCFSYFSLTISHYLFCSCFMLADITLARFRMTHEHVRDAILSMDEKVSLKSIYFSCFMLKCNDNSLVQLSILFELFCFWSVNDWYSISLLSFHVAN